MHCVAAPDCEHGLPYVHASPFEVHGVPSFGAMEGQPGVVGGGEHCHLIGGVVHNPTHCAQRQMVSP
jgi:hypothetical protein